MTDTRRRVLDASILMVAEGGVRAVSFREVARRAGVSHQAPYHHFPNHEAILHEIAQEGFAALADAMEQAGAEATDPVDALVGAGRAYLDFAVEHVGHRRAGVRPGPGAQRVRRPGRDGGEQCRQPEAVAAATLEALGRRSTVRPGTRAKMLGLALSTTPISLRTRILGAILRGFTVERVPA